MHVHACMHTHRIPLPSAADHPSTVRGGYPHYKNSCLPYGQEVLDPLYFGLVARGLATPASEPPGEPASRTAEREGSDVRSDVQRSRPASALCPASSLPRPLLLEVLEGRGLSCSQLP